MRCYKTSISLLFFFRWVHDYQDACVDKVEKFLTGEKSPIQKTLPPLPSSGSLNSVERSSPRNSMDRLEIHRNSMERLLAANGGATFSLT
jgi:hypothetical protein